VIIRKCKRFPQININYTTEYCSLVLCSLKKGSKRYCIFSTIRFSVYIMATPLIWPKLHFSAIFSDSTAVHVVLHDRILSSRTAHGLTLPCTGHPNVKLWCHHSCVFTYIEKYRPTTICEHSLNTTLMKPSLLLHRPAPQIISRPVTSVAAVRLSSNCTSKFTNIILTEFQKSENLFCFGGCNFCTWPISGFRFLGNFGFRYCSLLYRQSEM
jgi:hypothetical protein